MIQRKLHGVTIECLRGDIVHQPDMEAVVNAANAELRTGSGVAGAIHRAAGPKLDAECRPLAPLRPGQAVLTSAHALPNRYVIHCLGPVYGRDEPAASLLAACYRNALALADRNMVETIAFPALSTGAFSYPMEPAARIALKAILDELPELSSLRHIRMVLYQTADERIHSRVLEELADAVPASGLIP
jgi:O-acetyl-ADP-ribose deacetylase (regulator of RNase III)